MPLSLPQLFSFSASAPRYAGISTPSTFCDRFVEPEKGSSDARGTLGEGGEGEKVFDYVICGGMFVPVRSCSWGGRKLRGCGAA